MNASICAAIARRQVVEFVYSGTLRTVEPYTHGYSSAGNEVFRGYQTGGLSKSGRQQGWRLFRVDEISALRATGETFQPNRSDYNPNDRTIDVHCSV
ncbi:MAG: WYL domain-containing protein [Myxococcota bacterium]